MNSSSSPGSRVLPSSGWLIILAHFQCHTCSPSAVETTKSKGGLSPRTKRTGSSLTFRNISFILHRLSVRGLGHHLKRVVDRAEERFVWRLPRINRPWVNAVTSNLDDNGFSWDIQCRHKEKPRLMPGLFFVLVLSCHTPLSRHLHPHVSCAVACNQSFVPMEFVLCDCWQPAKVGQFLTRDIRDRTEVW